MHRKRAWIDRFVVAEESMEPALPEGTLLLGVRWPRPPARGSVLVVEHPHRSGFLLVKRVVGLPGERVVIEEGRVTIDGRADLDRWGRGETRPDGVWAVGPGEVLLLSDNREATRADARAFGPVPWKGAYRVVWPPRYRAPGRR